MSLSVGKNPAMEIVTFLAIYVALIPVCWKTFNYFNMTLVDAAMMTGFTYHLKKLAFALIAPFLISALTVTLIFENDETSVGSVVPEPAPTTVMPQEPPAQPSKPVAADPLLPKLGTEAVEHAEPTPVENADRKEDLLEQERKAQYHGDDPIVRRRLGLPPKPAGGL